MAMPLFQHPLRDYDGRRTLRSLADALEKLRELDGFDGAGDVQIKTKELTLPDGRVTGFVMVLGPRQPDGTRWVIRMPSSAKFTARTTSGIGQTYETAMLNEAISDPDGNVELADGQFLHHIDLIPTPISYEFTATDDVTVRIAVEFLQLKNQCYLPIDDKLLPGLRLLRYGTLPNIKIRRLKAVQHYVQKHLRDISPSAIATALRRAGMQFPRSRA